MYELVDPLIIRVFSDKHLHDEYIIAKKENCIYSPSGKCCKLPICGQELIMSDFSKMFDVLE